MQDPEKTEEEIQFVEQPDGSVEWKERVKRVTRVDGTKIQEVLGKIGRDYCCYCPPSKQDAGACIVGKRRVCQDHYLLCSACGRPTCHRHRSFLAEQGIWVCHLCNVPKSSPSLILFIILAVLAAILLFHLV